MTYIRPAAVLFAKASPGRSTNLSRVVSDAENRRTSGAIATSSAGIWLRNRAKSIVVLCLEQLVEGRRDCSLLERSGTIDVASVLL